jgi:DNA-binding transcriptional LysR family regulator
MDIGSLELRLLAAFEAVLRERGVTAAANALGLTQPAVSQALAKLRRALGDPLFVRAPHGVDPTPRALELAGPVADILRLARERLGQPAAFDPARAERTFTVFATDAGAVVFTPRVVRRLARVAPGIRIRIAPIVAGRFPGALAEGEADLAFGAFPVLRGGFFQQRLYSDDYVCLVRRAHPSVRTGLPFELYARLPHVVVSAQGTGHGHALIERMLVRRLPPGRIAVRVPSFLAAPMIVAQSDCVLTVPRRVAAAFARPLGLRVLPPPLALPPFIVRQYWHERFHRDPANRWLRALVAQLFGGR